MTLRLDGTVAVGLCGAGYFCREGSDTTTPKIRCEATTDTDNDGNLDYPTTGDW